MMNIEVIQRVQSLYSRGVQSDDSRLSNRHIFNKALTVRAKLLSQESKRKQKINQWNYQTLPCVEMIVAPVHDCPCIPDQGCTILKSKYPFPRVLSDMGRHLIQSVTTLDGGRRYDEATFEEMKNRKGNKYTGKAKTYFFRNDHLFITNTKELDVVTCTALFADPVEVQNFIAFCDGDDLETSCMSPLDMEFAIDPELTDSLIELTYKELAIMFPQMIEDKANNASDDAGMRQRQGGRW